MATDDLDRAATYFTFLDGVLSFDCAACGSECCRGKGIFLTREELDALDARYPGLAHLAAPPPGGARRTLLIAEPPPRCFFLRDDGRCGVQHDHGKQYKPTGCRLFPLQRFMSSAGVLTVGYADACPLSVGRGGDRANVLTYASLQDELDAVTDRSLFSAPPPRWLGEGFRDGIEAERRAREATRPALDRGDILRCLADTAAGDDPERLIGDARNFVGISGLAPLSADAARAFIAAVPEIRFRLALQHPVPWAALPITAQRYLCALVPYVQLHERLAGRPPTLSAVLGLVRDLDPLLWALSHLDSPVELAEGGPVRVGPQLAAATKLFLASAQTGATVREATVSAEPEPARRAAFLRGARDFGGRVSFGPRLGAPSRTSGEATPAAH